MSHLSNLFICSLSTLIYVQVLVHYIIFMCWFFPLLLFITHSSHINKTFPNDFYDRSLHKTASVSWFLHLYHNNLMFCSFSLILFANLYHSHEYWAQITFLPHHHSQNRQLQNLPPLLSSKISSSFHDLYYCS